MDDFLTLSGSAALSDFRLQALARELKAERILARHVHYVAFHHDSRELFGDKERQILDQLLDYDEPFREDLGGLHDEKSTIFYITPRVGTISPWVSVCGR